MNWAPALKGLMLAMALALLLVGIRQPVNIHDEGYVLYGATRISTGEIPYRDFWLVYTPAQFYLLAGLFSVFGSSVLLARGYDALVRLAIVVLVYRLARVLGGPVAALVPAAVALLLLATVGFYGYPVFPALALVLASVDRLLAFFAIRAWATLLGAGLLLGLAAMFRQDIGFAGLVAETLALAALTWRSPGEHLDQGFRGPRRRWRGLAPFALGMLLAVAPFAVPLLWAVPARELWWGLIGFPATVLPEQRALPYPGLPYPGMTRAAVNESLVFYVPLAIFGASLWTRGTLGTWLLTALGLGLFRLGMNRADVVHLLPGTIVALVLSAALLVRAERVRPRLLSVGLLALGAAVVGDAYVVQPVRSLLSLGTRYHRPQPPSSLEVSAGISGFEDQEAAVRYVRQHTAGRERILVGNTRHDRIFVIDMMFYVLAGRGSATRYHLLEPGVVTTRPVQQEIIAALEAGAISYVVLFSTFEDHVEPNASGRSSGVVDLDLYIRSHYRPVARFGGYAVWKRIAP